MDKERHNQRSHERARYKFVRLEEKHKIYFFSCRQEKLIPPHGSKVFMGEKRVKQLWWYLYPGAYYLYEYSKTHGGYYVHKLIIGEGPVNATNPESIAAQDGLYEEHRPVNYLPPWLQNIITKLPEVNS